jgi:phosphohistidine phosphatase
VHPILGGKTLMLMRHAKSDWTADYESDHQRPLNERGVRSARLMGRLLEGLDSIPDLVLTSTATRARDTARLAAEAGGWECPILEEPGLYGGSPDSVLEIVSGVAGADRLMLVGHEPVWSSLVREVSGRRVEMKTATVVVVAIAIESWDDLGDAQGVVTGIHHPRAYVGSDWDPG